MNLINVMVRGCDPVISSDVDCHQIVGMFPLSAPGRRTRHSELFHVPRRSGRVETVRRGLQVRLPQLLNSMMLSNPRVDWFLPSRTLRSDIFRFANGQGTYLS